MFYTEGDDGHAHRVKCASIFEEEEKRRGKVKFKNNFLKVISCVAVFFAAVFSVKLIYFMIIWLYPITDNTGSEEIFAFLTVFIALLAVFWTIVED